MLVRTELAGIPMIDVTRGERVESVHAVAACAVPPATVALLVRGPG